MKKSPRALVLEKLERSRKGLSLESLSKTSDDRDRRYILHTLRGTLRFRGFLDQKIEKLSSRPLSKIDAGVLDLLRMSGFELIFSRTPDYASIYEAVELAKSIQPKAASFVNALLRKMSRQPCPKEFDLDMLVPSDLASTWSDMFSKDGLKKLVENLTSPSPTTLRLNPLQSSLETLKNELEKDSILAKPARYLSDSLYAETLNFNDSNAFKAGYFYVQNESSQVPVLLLDPRPGERVLDLCAAPGGKTTQIAAATSNRCSILAVEKNKAGLEKMRENIRRLNCQNITIVNTDASQVRLEKESFDRVLVDAPCSSWGVLASHPEWRWFKKAEAPEYFHKKQRQILNHAAALLRPEGTLVYSVCTFSKEETTDVVDEFLSSHPSFEMEPIDKFLPNSMTSFLEKGAFRVALDAPPLDGFFAVRMAKRR